MATALASDYFVFPSGEAVGLLRPGKIASLAAGASLSLSVNGGPPVALTALELGSAAPPYTRCLLAKLPPPLKLKPADVATLTVPPGAVIDPSGPWAGVSDQPLLNLVGGTILGPVPDPVGMGLGWNIEPTGAANATILWSNLLRNIQIPGSVLTWDANGYPLTASKRTVLFALVQTSNDWGGLNKGLRNAPSGHYACDWPGPDVGALVSFGDTTATEVTAQLGVAGAARVFDLQHGTSTFAPQVVFSLTASIDNGDGTFTFTPPDSTPFVHPPDPSDPTGMKAWGIDGAAVPTFYPPTVAMIGPVQALRFMSNNEVNNNGIRDRSDFPPPSMLTRAFQQYFIDTPIASVSAVPPGVEPWFDTSQWMVIQVTTKAPRGLRDELGVALSGIGDAKLSDGSTLPMDQFIYGGIHTTSPTSFLAAIQGHIGLSMVGTIDPTDGHAKASYGGLMPLEEQLELCRLVGCGLYFNMPTTATPDCIKSVCDEIAAGLPRGEKCWLAWSNEVWNSSGNLNFFYSQLQSFAATGHSNFAWYQARQSKAVHDAGLASFAAAARPGDLVRVVETMAGNDAVTRALCDEMNAIGGRFEALSPAVYLDNLTAADPTSTGVSLDLLEMKLAFGSFFADLIDAHRAILDASGFASAGIVNYEGGLAAVATSPTAGYAAGHAIARHPRMKGLVEAGFCGGLQRSGVGLSCVFNLGQTLFVQSGYDLEWCTYTAFDQRPGTGDPTTDAINITDPERVDLISSEAGGGYRDWGNLYRKANPMAAFNDLKATYSSAIATQAADRKALDDATTAKAASDTSLSSATTAFAAAIKAAPGSTVVDTTVAPLVIYQSADGLTFSVTTVANITDAVPSPVSDTQSPGA